MQLLWRDVAPGPGPAINTSITLAETAELQRLAKDGRALEIGSAFGYSAIAMALAGAHVTAVDPHTGHHSFGTMHANLRVYGVAEKVEVLCSTSQNALPELFEQGHRFDLVFIDGDHTDPVVEHDVRWAVKLLNPGGTLACHDYDEVTCPGVRVALDRLFGGPGVLTDTLAVYENPSLR
jgi:predicted O-methyltransferase YrrM